MGYLLMEHGHPDDIAFVEELPNMVTVDEEVIPIVRLWVRKGSIAIRSIPFWVEDLA